MTIEEYYKILAEKYKKINWKSLESIKAYNEYARTLRKKLIKEEKKCLNKKKDDILQSRYLPSLFIHRRR